MENDIDGKYGGLPLDEDIIVKVKLEFNQDGVVKKAYIF